MFNNEERRAVLDARRRRGEEAKRLLEEPLLKVTLETMEEDIIRQMKALKAKDIEGRDVLWRQLQALSNFKKKLVSHVNGGKEARFELTKLFGDK